MARRYSALNLVNSNVSVVKTDPNPMYIMHEIEADITKLAEGESGTCVVQDEETARLVLSRLLEQPEPVLYEDEKTPLTSWVEDDTVAQLVELQLRMESGMDLIQKLTHIRDELRAEYYGLKDRIACGFEKIRAEKNQTVKRRLQGFMTKIVDKKNEVGAALGRTNDKLSKYWDHWHRLKDECSSTVNGNKAIWAVYFNIEDKDEWFNNYLKDVSWMDDDAIDEMEVWYDPQVRMDTDAISHLIEMKQFS